MGPPAPPGPPAWPVMSVFVFVMRKKLKWYLCVLETGYGVVGVRLSPGPAQPARALPAPDSESSASSVALEVLDALGAVLLAVRDCRCLAARALVSDPARPISLAAGRTSKARGQAPARAAGDTGHRGI